MVTETTKQPTFEPVFYNMHLYWLANLLIGSYNLFLLASYFQAGEQTIETNNPEAHFFYINIFKPGAHWLKVGTYLVP